MGASLWLATDVQHGLSPLTWNPPLEQYLLISLGKEKKFTKDLTNLNELTILYIETQTTR